MATYQNCEAADEGQQMTHGYGFHIRSNNRPIVTLVFATEEDAKQARVEIASAVQKAIEITAHG